MWIDGVSWLDVGGLKNGKLQGRVWMGGVVGSERRL